MIVLLLDRLVGPVIGIVEDVGPEPGTLTLFALVTDKRAEDAASID
jgi:hypothetical protein